MIKRKNFIIFILGICVLMTFSVPLYPFSDQTTTERILRENKHFVEFLDVCVTNFAHNKKNEFRKAYELHFNADVAYLQSDYKRAYKRIYTSQAELEKVYRDMVKDNYLEGAKTILDSIAPSIIRSKNSRARLYLTLGYRDRTVCWTHYTIAEASNPKLHSYKLYKYVEAIKMARRAKRFGFLALFESRPIAVKRKIYNQLIKNETAKGRRFFSRFADLNDKQYIEEMSKSFEEHEKEKKEKKDKIPQDGSKAGTDRKKGEETGTFEKRVEQRVRFRNEERAARYLINGEFDKAEDILRAYIEDYNFKLIAATFDVLNAAEKGASPEGRKKIDYEKYKIDLMDNYSRLTKSSVLESFLDTLKVEDDVKDDTKKSDETGESDKGKDNSDTSKKGNISKDSSVKPKNP